ncbi:GTP 3',8-cyclase MoaA [Parvularcula dongshanensis]|uniref:GTP 3',8-cyclase n=1 Tax=Parvularcula dongshanensis TaxID=1173995 RepID=A0A840I1Y2_9PROT|nr:GTP 3',8-cyclase MoaA [Parvularcula dongshanensis]MBB4658291.1 cyclic pyranopterin phosphate synthase [Parvularcula dongshanensis]
MTEAPLTDPFGRQIRYLRLSVTDRCDLRCRYCMAERMRFLPKPEVLSLEELDRVAAAFVGLGVRKLRITGGEPLVRRDVMRLFERLSRHLGTGALDEVTLTTNATQLGRHAEDLFACGVRRVNVSLDTIDPEGFAEVTRGGDVSVVLEGIEAAAAAGLHVKLNAVALKGQAAGIVPLIEWGHARGHDVTLIEVMPMGETGEDRADQFLPLSDVREALSDRWTLTPLPDRTGGPATYVRVEETGGRLGLITPLTNNFCDGCNRVRVTCTGQLYQCLGRGRNTDLRAVLREGGDDRALRAAIVDAVGAKPWGHDFAIKRGEAPSVARHMSVTGG